MVSSSRIIAYFPIPAAQSPFPHSPSAFFPFIFSYPTILSTSLPIPQASN